MRSKLLVLALSSLLTLSLVPMPSAHAAHSWAGLHWARGANPFTLQIGDNVDGRWDGALYAASNDWSASGVLDTVVVPGFTSPRSCRGTFGRVEVCNAYYGYTGWLGIASVGISNDGHITFGTVRLNDTYFDYPYYNRAEWRNSVTCQEIGHVLGLDHQDEDPTNPNLGSCMDYTDFPGDNQRPDAHDYAQLTPIYAHADRTTTVGTPASYGQQPSTSAYSWGRRIEGSWAQGQSTYWRYLGRGAGILTYVTWA